MFFVVLHPFDDIFIYQSHRYLSNDISVDIFIAKAPAHIRIAITGKIIPELFFLSIISKRTLVLNTKQITNMIMKNRLSINIEFISLVI